MAMSLGRVFGGGSGDPIFNPPKQNIKRENGVPLPRLDFPAVFLSLALVEKGVGVVGFFSCLFFLCCVASPGVGRRWEYFDVDVAVASPTLMRGGQEVGGRESGECDAGRGLSGEDFGGKLV